MGQGSASIKTLRSANATPKNYVDAHLFQRLNSPARAAFRAGPVE
jgi:hypothetical protein